MTYNELIVLPFWGLDQNTKEKLEQRNAGAKRDANYMNTSPGAAYDSNRNKRLLQNADDKHYNQVDNDEDTDFNMNHSSQ